MDWESGMWPPSTCDKRYHAGKDPDKMINATPYQKRIAVLTSGGDSQGMNSALRAIVRSGLMNGCRVFLIKEGYQGLIDGQIEEATWFTVSDIMHKGGTVIGTERCELFHLREGRKKAALTLLCKGINHLICIGGDGSLMGLTLFRDEWKGLVEELYNGAAITMEQANQGNQLHVVGLVGTIDNDFVGTDRTIGCDTALARILESIDAVYVTANSHRRVFIIEVMGRSCGHLALTSATAAEADVVFIPEQPPDAVSWPQDMCDSLRKIREHGRRLNIIILCEGAIDSAGKKITAEDIQKHVTDILKYETRTMPLLHLQRGGNATFLDRLLGARMGYQATKMLLAEEPSSNVVCLKGHTIQKIPLLRAVSKTRKVIQRVREGEYDLAAKLRGAGFVQKTDFIQFISEVPEMKPPQKTFAVIHVGEAASGMNSVTHAFTRIANHSQVRVIGARGSWAGFRKNQFKELTWLSVSGWVGEGGSNLGTSPEDLGELEEVVDVIKKNGIQGMLLVGGFQAYHSALQLSEARQKYPELHIPMVVVPASIDNNVPGTCISLGSDTSLNSMCREIDRLKRGASSKGQTALIIETGGGRCGYFASMTAAAVGADAVLLHETSKGGYEDVIKKMEEDATLKLNRGVNHYIVLRAGDATVPLNRVLDTLKKCNWLTIHVPARPIEFLNGESPSGFDRQMGVRSGIRAFEGLFTPSKMKNHDVCVLGVVGRHLKFRSVESLVQDACFEHGISLDDWWREVVPLVYHLNGMDPATERVQQMK